jgi:hypothetical protein
LNLSANSDLSGATVDNFETININGTGVTLSYTIFDGTNFILAMNGNEIQVDGTAGDDVIDLSTFSRTNAGIMNVFSGAGDDTITGNSGDEVISFTDTNFDANDTIDGTSGTTDSIAFSDAMTKDYETDFANVSNIDSFVGSTSDDTFTLDFSSIATMTAAGEVFDGNSDTSADSTVLENSVDVAGDLTFIGGTTFNNIETLDITGLTLTNADGVGGDGNELVLTTADIKNMTDATNELTLNITDDNQGQGVALFNSTNSTTDFTDLSLTGGDSSGNYAVDGITLHVV